jgi:polyisoprenoid-binding protein YceI
MRKLLKVILPFSLLGKTRTALSGSALSLSLLLASPVSSQVLAPTPSVAPGLVEYQIDPEHSSIQFSVRHLGISLVRGEFQSFKGSFTFPAPDAPADTILKARSEASIDVNSISSRVAKRDKHLKSADFLFASKFPEIKFSATSVEVLSPENLRVKGNLSLRGIEKEVQLEVTGGTRAKDPWGNERVGFLAKTKLNRFDYGVKWNQLLETGVPVVAPEVEVELSIEGMRAAATAPATTEAPSAPAK